MVCVLSPIPTKVKAVLCFVLLKMVFYVKFLILHIFYGGRGDKHIKTKKFSMHAHENGKKIGKILFIVCLKYKSIQTILLNS